MSFEAIDDGGFILKPGGAQEEGLPTDLAVNEYTHSSGITNTGRLIRTPGKRFVRQYTDRVLQIAGFGGAVIIQHGSTIEMFPDACAVSPTSDDDPRVQNITALPILYFNKATAHKQTTYPWANHPSAPRFGDNAVPVLYYYDYSFTQGPPSDYTTVLHVDPSDHPYMHRFYGCNAYTNATRNGGEWDYGCEISDEQVTGVYNLSAYSPSVYAKVELVGNYNYYDTHGSYGGALTTFVGNYTLDITKHLGKASVEIGIPLLPGAPTMNWDNRRDSQNTLLGTFQVVITGMRLTKFKLKDT